MSWNHKHYEPGTKEFDAEVKALLRRYDFIYAPFTAGFHNGTAWVEMNRKNDLSETRSLVGDYNEITGSWSWALMGPGYAMHKVEVYGAAAVQALNLNDLVKLPDRVVHSLEKCGICRSWLDFVWRNGKVKKVCSRPECGTIYG